MTFISRKTSLIATAVATSLLFSGAAFAGGDHDGDGDRDNHRKRGEISYTGPVETTSIADMIAGASLFSDQDVVVEGKIIRQIDKNTFVFSDGVQEVEMEVSRKGDYVLNDTATIRVFGEYEKPLFGTAHLDAKHIIVVQ
ncbi:NirD/YgiW/YdeI family stress tolerance protein [Rhodobacteraceae bacterium RKSG542]|uniref:NirD/YgiW/YdeI family stress tolerance protein n=1 Tax=Pseudovibrio flavus TaxID=2529854 RepID=UPI0012BCB473|nr:NirD/YgiW/YdeI family stress tolerance protein [Pseudovibrio flavus]MTI16479.1 NirD/YgiW/YdeI family stress tolerance protein [Pseudovibrio flavus]